MRGPYPQCEKDTCTNEHLPILRCSEVVSSEEDALFKRDGVSYGKTHFYCIDCIEENRENLKVWSEDLDEVRKAHMKHNSVSV